MPVRENDAKNPASERIYLYVPKFSGGRRLAKAMVKNIPAPTDSILPDKPKVARCKIYHICLGPFLCPLEKVVKFNFRSIYHAKVDN